jgi:two-component system, NarL family, nitrate/nitrite response regulator NarL
MQNRPLNYVTTPKNISFTQREIEVIQLLHEGYNGPNIAQKLFLSYHTVKTHKKNICQKLDVHTTVQLLNAARSIVQLA